MKYHVFVLDSAGTPLETWLPVVDTGAGWSATAPEDHGGKPQEVTKKEILAIIESGIGDKFKFVKVEAKITWQITCSDEECRYFGEVESAEEPRKCPACGKEDCIYAKPISKPCECGGTIKNRYCGVFVCDECGRHDGLTRCYCGWSESGGDGRGELVEMGEQIEEEG
jgi:hypothetical protein